MEKQKPIYCGSGKKQNDTWLKLNLNFSELEKHAEEYMGKKYVKINVNITEPDKYGKTLQASIDTWKPESKEAPKTFTKVANTNDSLPF